MINVAIIGVGIGQEHLTGYRAPPKQFAVKIMCDLDMASAATATQNDPSIQIVAGLDDVLSDPSIDLIDIFLPPHLYVPSVLAVLKIGKHAICEKPIARSIPEIEEMQVAMEASVGSVVPVFQHRYGLGLAQLRELLDAGLGGKAFPASAETHWNRQSDYYDIPWRDTWQGESSGSILGHAIHAHDLLTHIFGAR